MVNVIKFRLKVRLAMEDMNQKELAEKTGTVKHLPIEALNKICATLHCQPADLMEFIPDETGE